MEALPACADDCQGIEDTAMADTINDSFMVLFPQFCISRNRPRATLMAIHQFISQFFPGDFTLLN